MLDNPGGAFVAVDFDGTLSAVVDDPERAVINPAAAAALANLADRVGRCLVVSGRPVSFLRRQVPAGIDLVGLYGLEGVTDGVEWRHENCGVWREAIADVVARARAHGPDGMRVESKELTITLHYREHPELEEEVQALAATEAMAAGLTTRPARMSVELHPPIDIDKGTVLAREFAARAYESAMFIGDDVGDLPAFAELARFGAADPSRTSVRVVVRSEETSTELLDVADVFVDGVDGVVRLLGQLTDAS